MGESEVNVHALLFADRVITEHNGKRGIIGSFNRFSFRSIPGTSPPWFVFIVMDNLTEGAHELTINIVRRGSSEVVFSGGIQFGVADTAKGVDITVPIPPLVFPREGT